MRLAGRLQPHMHAAARFVDQLVENDAAVSDTLRGGEVVEPLHMEVGRQPERMCRRGNAADQRIDLRVAVAAGDLQRYPEQRTDLLQQRSGPAQVAQVRRRRRVGDPLASRSIRNRQFLERKIGRATFAFSATTSRLNIRA